MAKATRTPSQVAAQKQASTRTPSQVAAQKEVKYPEVKIDIRRGDNALTDDEAKVLLGWETESDFVAKLKTVTPDINEEAIAWGEDFFLKDKFDNKVRLKNNGHNRRWTRDTSMFYMHDMLKQYWQFNGESIIVGKYGNVLSGQHRLIALVLGEQTRTCDAEKDHWSVYTEKPLTLDCIIVYGIDETSEVKRTIDNVKARSLSDVIFADTNLFGKYKDAERNTITRYLDYAVKLLWARTGEGSNEWAPKKTNSELLDFVSRHSKLRECVQYIYDQEKDGKISSYLYPGHAAALMYMQAVSGTDDKKLDDYHVGMLSKPTDETLLSFKSMSKAKAFWADLASGNEKLAQVRMVQKPRQNDTTETGFQGIVFPLLDKDKKNTEPGGSLEERLGVLISAWNAYAQDVEVTSTGIELGYRPIKGEGEQAGMTFWELVQFPTVRSSIDVGGGAKKKKKKESEEPATPEEVQEANDEQTTIEDVTDEEGDVIAERVQSGPKVTKFKQEWDKLKADYADHVLVFESPVHNSTNLIAYYDDAEVFAENTTLTANVHPATGDTQCVISREEMQEDGKKLMELGLNILVIGKPDKNGEREISPWAPDDTAEQVPEQPSEAPKKVTLKK